MSLINLNLILSPMATIFTLYQKMFHLQTNQNNHHNWSLRILFMLVLLQLASNYEFRQLSVSLSNYQIRNLVTYNITMTRTQYGNFSSAPWNTSAVPANSNIIVQFPADYSPQLLNQTILTSITIQTNTGTLTPSASIFIQNNNLVLPYLFSSSTYVSSVNIVLNSIKNPQPAVLTASFIGIIGNDFSSSGATTSVVQLQPNVLFACSASFVDGFVNRLDNLTISFTSLSLLPSTSIVKVAFSKSYIRDPQNKTIITNSSMTCLSSQSNYGINCNSTVINYTVNVFNAFPINGSYSTTFQINGILTPPSIEQIDAVTIYTYNSAMVAYDNCKISFSNLRPVVINDFSASFGSNTLTVDSRIAANFTLPLYKLLNTFYILDSIVLTFSTACPSKYQLTSIIESQSNSQVLFNMNANSISSMNISSTINLASTQFLLLVVANVCAPPSSGQNFNVNLGIYRSGYLQATGMLSLSVSPNILATNNLRTFVSPSTVSTAAKYKISFVCTNPITSSGMLIILFPNQIQLSSSCNSTKMNSVTTALSLITNQNGINMTSLANSPSGSTITLQIQTIYNPNMTDPLTTNFTLRYYYSTSTNDLVFSGSYLPTQISYTAQQTISFSINSSSQAVMAANATWTFTISTLIQLPILGSIKIILYDIVSLSSNNTNTTCLFTNLLNSTPVNTFNTQCQISYNSLNSRYQLSANNLTHPLVTTFSLSIINTFTNPASTLPTNYFTIITYSSLGRQIQRSNPSSKTYLTITQPAPLVQLNITRTSTRNSDIANYTIYALQLSEFSTKSTDNNQVVLVFPNQLDLSNSTCSYICIVQNKTVTVKLTNSDLVGKKSVNFTIYNIVNAVSFAPPTRNISFKSVLNQSYYYSEGQSSNNYKDLTNNLPSSLTLNANKTKYNNTQLGQLNSLSIQINLINSSASYYSYYILTFAPQFYFTNPNCSGFNSSYLCTYDSTKRIIVFTLTEFSSASANAVSFQVDLFYNPNVTPSSAVVSTLVGFTSSNYEVNSYSGSLLNWLPSCTFPCRSCLANNASACTSCYHNPLISNFSYFNIANNQCLSACLQGQITLALPIGTCTACNNNCKQCSITTSNCTACNISSPNAYLYNFTCLMGSQCPSFHYPSSTYQCLHCEYPCSTCTNSTFCLTCDPNTYKYGNLCVQQCPLNYTVTNSVNRTCDVCSSICATCQIIPSKCVACSSDAIFFNDTCSQNCTAPYVIYNKTCVLDCIYPCQTCQIYATFCLTCTFNTSTPLYQSNGTCQTSCRPFTFQNYTSRMCVACSSLPQHCSNCRSNTNCSIYGGSTICNDSQLITCITCDSNYTLYYNQMLQINQCVISVPDGYASANGIAQKCVSPCLTCNVLANNCTSCKTLNYWQGSCLSQCPNFYYSATTTLLFNLQNQTTLSCLLCTPPCLTCTSQTSCLSCRDNTYFDGNQSCVSSTNCPIYTYPNSTYLKCNPCQAPCLECSSYIKCKSCKNNTYLYSEQCLANCPSGYFQNNTYNLCQRCIAPCQSCDQLGTQCLSCNLTTYYYSYNYSCLLDCPIGFFKNDEDRLCQNCTSPCLECNLTACNRCSYLYHNISYYLDLGMCVTTCRDGYFAYKNQSNPLCMRCDISCSTCTDISTCTKCNTVGGYKTIKNTSIYCVLSCPQKYPVLTFRSTQITCQPCSDTLCLRCTPNNKCIKCLNNSLALMSGVCYVNCPEGYYLSFDRQTNNSVCYPNQKKKAQQIAAEGITLTLPINFPCSILAGFFCLLSFLIKFYQSCCKNNNKVLIFPLLSASLSIPELCAFCLSGGSYMLLRYKTFFSGISSWDVFLYFYLACILFSIAVSIYVTIIQYRIISEDKLYNKWKKHSNCIQKTFQYLVNLLSLFNFKIAHVLWCGIKSLPFLQSANKLVYFNKPSGLSVLIALAFTSISIVNLTYHQQLKYIYIDSIIVVLTSTLFSLLALRRPYDFFVHQIDELNNLPINKRVVSSDDYLVISGLTPIKNYEDDFYSKLKRRRDSELMNESLNDELSSSGRSARTSSLLMSHKSSVRLQNFSLQCTLMQDSSRRQKDQPSNQFYSEMMTNQVDSVQCQPGGKSSILQNIQDKTQKLQVKKHVNNVSFRQVSLQSQIEQEHPTNLGMLEMGQNQSCSAQNDEEFRTAKYLLPIEFRRYQTIEEAPHNYSAMLAQKTAKQNHEESLRHSQAVRVANHSQISAQLAQSLKNNSAQRIQVIDDTDNVFNINNFSDNYEVSVNSAQVDSYLGNSLQNVNNIIVVQPKQQKSMSNSMILNISQFQMKGDSPQPKKRQEHSMNGQQSFMNVSNDHSQALSHSRQNSRQYDEEHNSQQHNLSAQRGNISSIMKSSLINYGKESVEADYKSKMSGKISAVISNNLSFKVKKSRVSSKYSGLQPGKSLAREQNTSNNGSKNLKVSKLSQNKSQKVQKLKESLKSNKFVANQNNPRSIIPNQSVESVQWQQGEQIQQQRMQYQQQQQRMQYQQQQQSPQKGYYIQQQRVLKQSIKKQMIQKLERSYYQSQDQHQLQQQKQEQQEHSVYLTKKMTNEPISNQFRIQTKKKKKKKKQTHTQKQMVYFVDDQRFRALKSEFTVLRKQIRRNQRLQKQVEEQSRALTKQIRRNSKQLSKQKRRNSGSKVEEVYLSRVSPPKTNDK